MVANALGRHCALHVPQLISGIWARIAFGDALELAHGKIGRVNSLAVAGDDDRRCQLKLAGETAREAEGRDGRARRRRDSSSAADGRRPRRPATEKKDARRDPREQKRASKCAWALVGVGSTRAATGRRRGRQRALAVRARRAACRPDVETVGPLPVSASYDAPRARRREDEGSGVSRSCSPGTTDPAHARTPPAAAATSYSRHERLEQSLPPGREQAPREAYVSRLEDVRSRDGGSPSGPTGCWRADRSRP